MTTVADLGSVETGVTTVSPVTMVSASLERVSGGRFVLGTGVSTEKAIEDLHGTDFDRPVRRAHETIAEAARRVGRDPDDITVAPSLPTAASEDREETRRGLTRRRRHHSGSF